MSLFGGWDNESVSVKTVTGYDESGAQTVVTHSGVLCQVDDGNQLVRDPQTGDETVSSTRLHLALQYAAWFPLNSAVTVRGQVSEVIDRIVAQDGDPDLDGVTVVLK